MWGDLGGQVRAYHKVCSLGKISHLRGPLHLPLELPHSNSARTWLLLKKWGNFMPGGLPPDSPQLGGAYDDDLF